MCMFFLFFIYYVFLFKNSRYDLVSVYLFYRPHGIRNSIHICIRINPLKNPLDYYCFNPWNLIAGFTKTVIRLAIKRQLSFPGRIIWPAVAVGSSGRERR